jgi:hypothetical protein
MKRSRDLETEYIRVADLWHFLYCAEQLVVNHELLHEEIHADLSKCLQIVSDYQDEILFKLHPDSDLVKEIKAHKQQEQQP